MEDREDLRRDGGRGTGGGRRLRIGICCLILAAICLLYGQAAGASSRIPTYQPPRVDRNRKDIILYVGDSRTMFYALQNLKEKRDGLIYQNGAAIGALRYHKDYRRCSQLARYLRDALRTYPNAKVVLNFGCNGNFHVKQNARKIEKEYRKWRKAYPGRAFYVASVFPAARKKGSYTRKKTHALNRLLRRSFPKIYVDGGEYLERKGLDRPRKDGKGFARYGGRFDLVHYSKYASRAVKQYIRQVVMEEMPAS